MFSFFTLVCTFFAFNKATALALAVPFCNVAPGFTATFLPLADARAFADNFANKDCGFFPATAFLVSLVLGLVLVLTFFTVAGFLTTGFFTPPAAVAGFLAGSAFLAAAGLVLEPEAAEAAEVVEGFFSGFLSPGLAVNH